MPCIVIAVRKPNNIQYVTGACQANHLRELTELLYVDGTAITE